MTDVKINHVQFLEHYRMDIALDNGHRVIYNLKPKLTTVRFKELEDWEVFSKGKIVLGTRICWYTGVEVTLNEIMYHVNHI